MCVDQTLSVSTYCVCVSVTQSCPTLCDPMDCSPPGSSVRGILQARTLEWVAILYSRGSFPPRDWTRVSWIAGRLFTAEAWGKPSVMWHLLHTSLQFPKAVCGETLQSALLDFRGLIYGKSSPDQRLLLAHMPLVCTDEKCSREPVVNNLN